jgi:hypothetical protein
MMTRIMDDSTVAKETREFIQMYVPSLGALEVLLLLLKSPQRSWTVDSITKELRSNTNMIRGFVHFFQSKGVLKNEGENYSLVQGHDAFLRNLQELSELFSERPVTILNEIYSTPKTSSKIQIFADAFRIKKEK